MQPKSSKILVTIPTDLHDRVKTKADELRRSLSGYVGYILDSAHPAPVSTEEFVRKQIHAKVEELKSLSTVEDGQTVLFLRDGDGILQPHWVDGEGQITTRQIAASLVYQRLGVMSAQLLEKQNINVGQVSVEKSKAADQARANYNKWLKEQGIDL